MSSRAPSISSPTYVGSSWGSTTTHVSVPPDPFQYKSPLFSPSPQLPPTATSQPPPPHHTYHPPPLSSTLSSGGSLKSSHYVSSARAPSPASSWGTISSVSTPTGPCLNPMLAYGSNTAVFDVRQHPPCSQSGATPATYPPCSAMNIKLPLFKNGMKLFQVPARNGAVTVQDVLIFISEQYRYPLSQNDIQSLPEQIQQAALSSSRRNRRPILACDCLGADVYFFGLQKGEMGIWEAILRPLPLSSR